MWPITTGHRLEEKQQWLGTLDCPTYPIVPQIGSRISKDSGHQKYQLNAAPPTDVPTASDSLLEARLMSLPPGSRAMAPPEVAPFGHRAEGALLDTST